MSYERRKVRVGVVVGDRMDKTVVVAVEWRQPYALYRKSVRRRTKFKAHDAENQYRLGDTVRIMESRPISKTKRWRVVELLQREEIAEIQPDEIVVEELVELESVLVAGEEVNGAAVAEEATAGPIEAEAEAEAQLETEIEEEMASESGEEDGQEETSQA